MKPLKDVRDPWQRIACQDASTQDFPHHVLFFRHAEEPIIAAQPVSDRAAAPVPGHPMFLFWNPLCS